MVSTRTVAPASLPNASACFLNSSSEAGTKWFQERNVSSCFWAKAGARPSASQDAMLAVAPEVMRRNSRREVARIERLLGTQRAARKLFGTWRLVPPPFRIGRLPASITPRKRCQLAGGCCSLLEPRDGHGGRPDPAPCGTIG